VSPSPDQILRWAAANPDDARLMLARPRAERSLIEFMELMWPVVEPGRRLVRGWALEAIARHLEAVTDGLIRHLLICVPPGFSKSLLTNVFWPAWEMGPRNLAHHRYFTAAYAEHLTIRDNRKCLAILESPSYRRLWGDRVQIDPNQRAKTKFDTLQTGWKLATSVGGTGTGERGDRVIVDDALSAADAGSDAKIAEMLQWWTEVIPTRINDAATSAMVVIAQRLDERDIPGHVLANDPAGIWDRLILPMEHEPDHPHPSRTRLNFRDPRTKEGELLFPERFPRDYLETNLKPTLRSWGGEYAISGQLQQRPAPRGGGMFKRDQVQRVHAHEVPPGEDVRGWDLAASKDGRAAYTVGLKMRRVVQDGRVRYYVTDVVRDRLSPGEVRSLIRRCAERDGRGCVQDIPQDPGQAGLAQKSDLAQLLDGYSFHFSLESGSKEDRARPLASQVEIGNVLVVSAPWTDRFLSELAVFPAGQFKDQVDAASRAYARLLRTRVASVGAAAELVPLEPIE
jgi:predicted phage terminase large subunit-like protein